MRMKSRLLVSATLLASFTSGHAAAAIGDTQTFSDGGTPVIGDGAFCVACVANGWTFSAGGIALDAGEEGTGDHALVYDSGGFGFHFLTWEEYTTADTNFIGNYLDAGVVAIRFRARHSGTGDSVVLRAFLWDRYDDGFDWAISDGSVAIANTDTAWHRSWRASMDISSRLLR